MLRNGSGRNTVRRTEGIKSFFAPDGELPDHLLRLIDGRISQAAADVFPPFSTYPDIFPRRIVEGKLPPGLARRFARMYACVEAFSSVFRRHYEIKFLRKAGPRNVLLASKVLAKFGEIRWEWPAGESVSSSAIISAWDDTVGRRAHSVPRLHDVKPPKAQASEGIWLSPTGEWNHGHCKAESWWEVRQGALELWKAFEDIGLTWDDISTPKKSMLIGQRMADQFGWVFAPAYRRDGGMNKPRLLLIGDPRMYMIETCVMEGIKDLKTRTSLFAKPKSTASWFAEAGELRLPLLSGDYVGFDLHVRPEALANAWKAACTIGRIPPALAVPCFLYMCYTPVLSPMRIGNRLHACIRWRNGQAPSGTGAFSEIEDLIAAGIQRVVWGEAAERFRPSGQRALRWVPGVLCKDDHVSPLPPRCGAARWRSIVGRRSSLDMDPSDTKVSRQDAKFLRRFWRVGSELNEPIYMSRARNVVFPESEGLGTAMPILRGLRVRDQSHEVIVKGGREDRGGRELVQAWEDLSLLDKVGLFDICPLDVDLRTLLSEVMSRRAIGDAELHECMLYVEDDERSGGW